MNADGSFSLSCSNNESVECEFYFEPFTEEEVAGEDEEESMGFDLRCKSPRKCEAVGSTMKLPVSKTTGNASCPQDLWNACTVKFIFENMERSFTSQMGEGCEDKVGTMKKFFYSREKDDFVKTWSDSSKIGRPVGLLFVTIGTIIVAASVLYLREVFRDETFCHGSNAVIVATRAMNNAGNSGTTYVQTDTRTV